MMKKSIQVVVIALLMLSALNVHSQTGDKKKRKKTSNTEWSFLWGTFQSENYTSKDKVIKSKQKQLKKQKRKTKNVELNTSQYKVEKKLLGAYRKKTKSTIVNLDTIKHEDKRILWGIFRKKMESTNIIDKKPTEK